jgi:hypothetical protein
MWKEIVNKSDVDEIMVAFGDFHDTCIRDIYISTGEFVDDACSMHFDNPLTISLLFQRQSRGNSVLELKFETVRSMNFTLELAYGSTLNDEAASIAIEDNLVYWANAENWTIGDNDYMWIGGEKLFWRLQPQLAGNITRIAGFAE